MISQSGYHRSREDGFICILWQIERLNKNCLHIWKEHEDGSCFAFVMEGSPNPSTQRPCSHHYFPHPSAPMSSGEGKQPSWLEMGWCHFADLLGYLQNGPGIKTAVRSGREGNMESSCAHLESMRAVSCRSTPLPYTVGSIYLTGSIKPGRDFFSPANATFRSPVTIFASLCSVTTWYQLCIWRQPAGKKLLAFHTLFLLTRRLQQAAVHYSKEGLLMR